ncbi:hypothetical protein PHAVU_004G057100 [Phaseolus vulgaris]|uniref:Uncharacterized protein n=1 Tax=Phaseolus vulgaris TaxID=3885 RepID=V7C2N0_PHAVU|nr:hypothetical protein PHAVU_004G057100g [Phaseolus vulgaris]ESW23555.1 hypothetical protein PHAVU_004G057100g [Phaseolus vulgaris]
MATSLKYLICVLFLSFAMKGSSFCNLNNINIGTTRSGRTVGGKPEWNVVVKNNCNCSQSQIRLSCEGFKTTESVSPSLLSIQGNSCLLISGNALLGFQSISFSYAWDPPFLLLPLTSHTSCSS